MIQALGVVALTGCANERPASREGVGFTVISIADSTRPFIGPNGRVPRPLHMYVWYPAAGGTGSAMTYRDYIWYAGANDTRGSPAAIARYRAAYESERGDSVPAAVLDRALASPVKGFTDKEATEGRSPVLVLETGLNAPAFLYPDMAEALAAGGIVVAALPSFGHATDRPLLFDSAAVATQTADLHWALAALKNLPYVDTTRMFTGAWSVGAVAASLVAQQLPDVVKGIVSLDGAVGYQYGVDLARRTGLRPACLAVPLLHITGTRPGTFRVEKSRALFEQLPGGDAYWAAAPGLNHGDFTSYYSGRSPGFEERPDRTLIREGQRRLYDMVAMFLRRYSTGADAGWDSLVASGPVERLPADTESPDRCQTSRPAPTR